MLLSAQHRQTDRATQRLCNLGHCRWQLKIGLGDRRYRSQEGKTGPCPYGSPTPSAPEREAWENLGGNKTGPDVEMDLSEQAHPREMNLSRP